MMRILRNLHAKHDAVGRQAGWTRRMRFIVPVVILGAIAAPLVDFEVASASISTVAVGAQSPAAPGLVPGGLATYTVKFTATTTDYVEIVLPSNSNGVAWTSSPTPSTCVHANGTGDTATFTVYAQTTAATTTAGSTVFTITGNNYGSSGSTCSGTPSNSQTGNGTLTINPTVSSIAPSTGPTAGGTSVTITGTGFSATASADTVKFGSNAVTTANITSASTTSLTVNSPAGSAGTVDVTVTVGGEVSATSSADQFTYSSLSVSTPTQTTNPVEPGASTPYSTITVSNATSGDYVKLTASVPDSGSFIDTGDGCVHLTSTTANFTHASVTAGTTGGNITLTATEYTSSTCTTGSVTTATSTPTLTLTTFSVSTPTQTTNPVEPGGATPYSTVTLDGGVNGYYVKLTATVPDSGSFSDTGDGCLQVAANTASFSHVQVTAGTAGGNITLTATEYSSSGCSTSFATATSTPTLTLTTFSVSTPTQTTNPVGQGGTTAYSTVTLDGGVNGYYVKLTATVPGGGSFSDTGDGCKVVSANTASFGNVHVTAGTTGGNITLTATEYSNSGCSTSFATATSMPTLSVLPYGAAAKVVFSTQPVGNVTEGSNFFTMPSVSVEDSNNNVVASDASTVTLAISTYTPGNGGTTEGTLSCSNTGWPNVQASNGVVNFTNCQITGTAAAGTYTLAATDGSLTPTGNSSNVVINAGSVNSLSITTQPGNFAVPGGSTSVGVTAYDQYGNVATGSSDNVTLTPSPSATFTGLGPVALSGGTASFTISTSTPGNYTVTANDSAINSTASNTFTAYVLVTSTSHTLNDNATDTGGSGVSSVAYYYCSGFVNTTPVCNLTSGTPHSIGTTTTPSDGTGNWPFSWSSLPANGDYQVFAVGTDNAGNSTTSAVTPVTVQNQNSPTLSVSAPATDATNTAIPTSAISSLLAGGTTSPAITGTITFSVMEDASVPTSCYSSTDGWTQVGTATVTANGTYYSSSPYTPTSAGTYYWYASYGGDTNNNPAVTTCGSGMTQTVVSTPATVTFNTATTHTLTVPAHTTSVSFTIVGAGGGGGSGYTGGYAGGNGGAGGSLSGTITLPDSSSATTFTVVVGGPGTGGVTAGGAAGSGGSGCAAGGAGGKGTSYTSGGGGGGSTCIYVQGAPGSLVAVAGGGAGGSGYGNNGGDGSGGAASNGGTSTGGAGGSASATGGGGGSTVSSGSGTVTSNTGGSGSAGTGGTCLLVSPWTCTAGASGAAGSANGGGGGGGGEASGGGGSNGATSTNSGGGGGGSGYSGGTSTDTVANASITVGTGSGTQGGGGAHATGGTGATGGVGYATFTGVGIS